MTLGDQIVVMDDGRIQQVGSPYDIYNEPANQFVAEFIGSPSTNIFEATIEFDGEEVRLQAENFTLPLPNVRASDLSVADGDVVYMGIRPEYMHVVPESEGIFTADIDVRELHGEHDAIYFTAGGNSFTVTEPQGRIQDIELPKGIDFDADNVWLFDETGERVL